MSRRTILSNAERESLLALPDDKDLLIRQYAFSQADLSIIKQRRGNANRLGFAVHLCYMRYPGVLLELNDAPAASLLYIIAEQLKVPVACWNEYGVRAETRREHLLELQSIFGFKTFSMKHYRPSVCSLDELSRQTDKGIILATALINRMREQKILLPSINVLERICAEAITRSNRRMYALLDNVLSDTNRQQLEKMLQRKDNSSITLLAWLRQSPLKPNSRYMLEHIERLKVFQALNLPDGIERLIHQNRLLKIAREGGQMKAADIAKFEPQRRYATLVALAIEGMATVTDEIIDLHDQIIGKFFSTAKNKHQQQFHQSGKAINHKLRLYGRIGMALVEAKQSGVDPFAAIESVLPWDDFIASVNETQKLAQPEDFDFIRLVGQNYATLRRYSPAFLNTLKLRSAPATQHILDAIDVLRNMHTDNSRELPKNPPTEFIKKRWEKLVHTERGIDRRYYELCALSELKNALRSGDVWVQGSRQFKDFEEYFMPVTKFAELKQANALPLSVVTDCDAYLSGRTTLLEERLATVNRLAAVNDLPDAIITESGLKITPLDAVIPDGAQILINQVANLLPHVKITDLLLEVDAWTGFTRHFTHLKTV